MTITYDHNFNQNEWIVISFLILGLSLLWKLRKRFPTKEVLIYSLYSVFLSIVLDHTISIAPFDYYDVHDSSSFQLIDFVTYFMYGPYGYFFIYFYDYFKIKNSYTPIYIFIWAVISVTSELFFDYLGVFHYKNGYNIYYSFPIYLISFCLFIFLYRFIKLKKRCS